MPMSLIIDTLCFSPNHFKDRINLSKPIELFPIHPTNFFMKSGEAFIIDEESLFS
jgi:hypothetical protein